MGLMNMFYSAYSIALRRMSKQGFGWGVVAERVPGRVRGGESKLGWGGVKWGRWGGAGGVDGLVCELVWGKCWGGGVHGRRSNPSKSPWEGKPNQGRGAAAAKRTRGY